ncbi:HAMP domain-containing sensor histidine kinase [Exiguobacterium sp. BRG2]|uniref:HAMP domain-containing sensor histidine kinase n=1 Tax=unclassified Exiguobacterium TaxID=2644629 RepID=UPI000E9E2792|nr:MULTISPECIES: HAMP domain-containing sensor histidine kinase [unclassified Exiguobacterium]MDT0173194.1 HAMP domain-containing sensor histidine kinase [Exiguobacterium sp. BRG2]HBF58464.1 sensor histidine kinase [Exiguobacterium sp.]HCV52094.1 sensor histidine kinase [Exiguobacterium sp.]
MKLRTKLALSVTAFTTLLLFLSFIVVTLVVQNHLIESRYTQLEQAEELMEDDSSVRTLLTLHEDAVVLSNENGRWVISNDEDGDDPSTVNGDIQANDLPGIPRSNEPFKSGDWFGIVYQDQAYLFEDESVDDTVSTLVLTFTIVLVVGIVIAFISSFWIAYQTLRPLRQLNDTMQRISSSGTLETVQTERDDEIGRLGRVFNQMIGRVDQTMEQQRQFVADVSHEMKTPLTVIEGYAQLLKRWGKTKPDVLDESIEHILQETHAMRTTLIEPMLELSRLGYEETSVEVIDLAELGSELADRMYHATGTIIPVDASGTIRANREAVLRILTIYIDNVLKYATSPELHLRKERLAVLDRGTSLTDEERARLFDRFYRLDAARDRSGSGLGLSIAAALATTHHFKVGSEARQPDGSCFYLIPEQSE